MSQSKRIYFPGRYGENFLDFVPFKDTGPALPATHARGNARSRSPFVALVTANTRQIEGDSYIEGDSHNVVFKAIIHGCTSTPHDLEKLPTPPHKYRMSGSYDCIATQCQRDISAWVPVLLSFRWTKPASPHGDRVVQLWIGSVTSGPVHLAFQVPECQNGIPISGSIVDGSGRATFTVDHRVEGSTEASLTLEKSGALPPVWLAKIMTSSMDKHEIGLIRSLVAAGHAGRAWSLMVDTYWRDIISRKSYNPTGISLRDMIQRDVSAIVNSCRYEESEYGSQTFGKNGSSMEGPDYFFDPLEI